MSASHLAHLLATIHGIYAMQSMGPYACAPRPPELGYRSWADLWTLWHNGGPCWRRVLMMALNTLFAVALQRVIPCVLWLPLFLVGARRARQ